MSSKNVSSIKKENATQKSAVREAEIVAICENWRKARMFAITIIIFLLMTLCLVLTSKAEVPPDRFIKVLIQVESSGNDKAVGDKKLAEWAYGPLQIRQEVCDDYNAHHGTSYKSKDCQGNRPLSIKICKWYLDNWSRKSGLKVTEEVWARIWNGGPKGCFDEGAIDRHGRKLRHSIERSRLIRVQINAKMYWVKKVSPRLRNVG